MTIELPVVIENHPNDSRVKFADVFQTLSSRMGTGGGNAPMVIQQTNEDVPLCIRERCGCDGGVKAC